MFGSGKNRSDYIVDASGCSVWKQPSCVRKEGVRFGQEPKCVRIKTVIPQTIMCYVMLG